MGYLILSIIFGVISIIGFVFPTGSDQPVPTKAETSVADGQPSAVSPSPSVTPAGTNTSSNPAAPTGVVPTAVGLGSSFPVVTQVPVAITPVTFANSRLRFSFVYNSSSEAIVECPTLGETVDITQYLIAGTSLTVGCSQITGIPDLSVERKADINGTVIIPTYNSKKDQLMQQNPSMTVEFESDTSIGGKSGKRWKTSAFDLIFIEFDGVLYIFSPKMTEINRQFQFTQN